MGAFDTLNAAAASFNDNVMGESFSYTPPNGGTTLSGLTGVFNQVAAQFDFEDFSMRRVVDLTCVSRKTQWTTAPAARGTVTYGGITYKVEAIDGADSAGEPCYTLSLKRLS